MVTPRQTYLSNYDEQTTCQCKYLWKFTFWLEIDLSKQWKIKYSSVTNPQPSNENDGEEHHDQQQPETHDPTEKVEHERWVFGMLFLKLKMNIFAWTNF